MVEPRRESLEETLERVKAEIGDTERKLGEIKESFAEKMRAHFVLSVWKNVDQEKISDFVKRPFFTEPVKNSQGQYVEGEWRLIIHEFLPMQVGWLEYQKDGWNVYRVNKYVDWLAEIPEALKEELGVYEPSLKFSYDLEKALLQLEAGTAQDLKKKFGAFISSQVGQNSFTIKSTQRFNFLLEALKSGIKPFREKSVDKKDLFDSPRADIELREHQEDAWSTFLKYSRIGVFWPPGAGKTAFGKFAVGAVRGKKLIIVHSVALKEHWEKELRGIAGLTKDEYEVITFAAATSERIRRTEYTLVIVDEVHHWPANTYSELAFHVKTKYLIGLSATPWREDGRADLIFALCGYPVGRDWTYFWKKGLVKKPTAKVYVVRDFNAKVVELEGLLRSHVTTLIYCDGVEHGKMLAAKLKCEFVYGETKKALQTIEHQLEHKGVVIVSRVGDEGLSLHGIQRVIEFEFLYGSRGQEAQRAGRLFHADEEAGEHYLLMTAEEFGDHKKRVYGLIEKGLDVKVESHL